MTEYENYKRLVKNLSFFKRIEFWLLKTLYIRMKNFEDLKGNGGLYQSNALATISMAHHHYRQSMTYEEGVKVWSGEAKKWKFNKKSC